jgi:PAS domain S-box-containing protein
MRERVDHNANERPWTFLTAHAQVLVCIDRRPDARVKDIAADVGITDRAVQTILAELVGGGYVDRRRVGKRNHYRIDRSKKLRHALVRELEIGTLLANVSEPRALGEAQAELERSQERYRRLVERLPVVVYRSSRLTGDWHYISPAIESLLGYTAEEWLEHHSPWGESIHPDDRANAVSEEEQALEQGRPLSSEYRLRRRDGTEVWVRDDAFLIEEDGEPQWHGVLSDVSQRRALEERLRQSQKVEAVGQLAGGIAHDFNNLLVAIIGYGELALDRAGDDADLRHSLEQIAFAAAKSRDLTQRLLSFSRKEARITEVVDLNEIVASAHPMVRRLIGADLELVTLPAEQACLVSVDPTELDQAMLNLTVNARDAMPAGGRLTISTGLATRADSAYTFLRVADTGSGIDPEIVPRLFEPFFTTKEAGIGTGLGLAMVRDFVGGCGGMIEVETDPAEGTAFTLLLPAVGAPAVLAAPAPSSGTASNCSETILLIEDDDGVREIARRVLSQAGYTVIEARYGSEALDLAAEHPGIDLVLSDVVMPGLSGPEVVQRLLATRPKVVPLFMSGYAPESEGPLGGAELVRKPFTGPDLLAAIRRAVDSDAAKQDAAVVPA